MTIDVGLLCTAGDIRVVGKCVGSYRSTRERTQSRPLGYSLDRAEWLAERLSFERLILSAPVTPSWYCSELLAQQAEHVRLKKAGQIEPWVFFRMIAKGRSGKKEAQPIRAFSKAWAAACTAAGCPGRIPHDLRRTAIRNMVRAAVPERVAMKLTGHKTRSVFERYNIVSDGDLNAAAVRLNGLMGPTTGPNAGSGDHSSSNPKTLTSRQSA